MFFILKSRRTQQTFHFLLKLRQIDKQSLFKAQAYYSKTKTTIGPTNLYIRQTVARNLINKVIKLYTANCKMTTYFTQVKIEIGSYAGAKRPKLTKNGSFYCIYSPECFMLRPRDNILLDLKIKINAPERLEAWINLLPCLKERGFKIEEHNWPANRLKDTTQLNILNRNFTKTTHIKKDQEIAYMFLLGQKFNEKVITEYTTIT